MSGRLRCLGNCKDLELESLAGLERRVASRLPLVISPKALAGGFAIFLEDLRLPKPKIPFDLGRLQRSRVPPDHAVGSLFGPMEPRLDRGLEQSIVIGEHGAFAKLRTTLGGLRVAASVRRGVDPLVQRRQPALSPGPKDVFPARLIFDRRNHQQVAGPSRRHIGDANAFRPVPCPLLFLVLQQLPRRAADQVHRAQTLLRVNVEVRLTRSQVTGDVGEDHDGKLQPLGAVHGHDADALGAFFEHRRLPGFVSFRLHRQLLDETAERDAAAHLEAPRQVANSIDVCQHLVAGRPQGESSVRTRTLHQRADRLNDGPPVATAVEFSKQIESLHYGFEILVQLVRTRTKRMQAPNSLPEAQQDAVGDRKERTL